MVKEEVVMKLASFFFYYHAKIIHALTSMSRNVRQCPAMSRYDLIKVEKKPISILGEGYLRHYEVFFQTIPSLA